MFGPALRVILIVGSLLTVVFMLLRIRKSKMQIRDSIFWIVFALILLFISIFPRLVEWVSFRLGFIAPINFVYLAIIFVLLVKQFSSSVRISRLDERMNTMVQKFAIHEKYSKDGAEAECTVPEVKKEVPTPAVDDEETPR